MWYTQNMTYIRQFIQDMIHTTQTIEQCSKNTHTIGSLSYSWLLWCENAALSMYEKAEQISKKMVSYTLMIRKRL